MDTYQVHPDCLGLLLHDRAHVGTPDPQGWFEVHNACRFGLPRHLELLLLYGADMHARNESGMTSLHICALNGQESCARLLLLRGADKSSQVSPYQKPLDQGPLFFNLKKKKTNKQANEQISV